MKRSVSVALMLLFAITLVLGATSEIAGKCMTCHKEKTAGMYKQWLGSNHARHNVTCYDCHAADRKDPDAFKHEGSWIATLVTPKDCGQCHPNETEQVSNSYHAHAGEILDSKDAYLAHVAGGNQIAIMGCESCHGSKVQIDPDSPNKLSKLSWPNSGIGRINPDGSKGACSACHTRHSFDKAQARQPEACSKCHLGPDHPQKEVYEESKHGNTYYTNIDKMNLDSDKWVVGEDYNIAPTCATCHMSATPNQKVTHDVGNRISWTLRPPVSKRKDNWTEKKEHMQDVCSACHETQFVDNFYYQFDGVVRLYNEKFAKPATEIMNLLRKNNRLERQASFSNKIEWVYWELWHHEGRRVRHGAAMGGPDYAWWHGMYDVAQNFYFEFIPEAQHYNDPEVNAYIEELFTKNPMHNWITRSTEELKAGIRSGEIQKVYEPLFEEEK
ncbi:MAG: hypothetical protein HOD43_13445 [Candidatus Marinimicrobia bacterium]|jgi:hypothetical protein|nr:hypothetical protein [Candidatus Neomarinimicrobiota bacterium]MBT3629775.1 hypothetical protein [Candidatus Neomarinimicrobiota bacterium]MBT3825657.1 hypothetical protein [Candidatus Neomarinimicrobiota bacterium]MBT4132499.1 hypothetical protein [Candidatus Neomarinimicrobiota bacterium]MBT4296798.1 hypothetical protein [Candidatus Neomarinimicrobiota bacterium]